MRKITRFILAIALMAAVAFPAGAQTTEVLEACDTENERVGLDDPTIGIETPTTPDPVEGAASVFADFTLDLAGNAIDDDRARVDVTLVINDTLSLAGAGSSDFELYANGGSSAAFNPTDGNEERVSIGTLTHCSTINVGVGNFAGDPSATLTLEFNVR